LDHLPAWVCGAGGGAIASIAQFLGTTFNECVDHLLEGDPAGMTQLKAFLIGTAVLSF
jgi:hypothetical protein